MNDEQLVKQFQSGEKKSFDELVRRYQEKVLNTCFRFLGQSDDARDATQDIFIKVYYALDSFKPKARFSTWLYRIAVNHSLNVLRAKKRRAWLSSLSMVNKNEKEIGIVADLSKDPLATIESNEQTLRIHKALNRLKKEQRIAIVLHTFEGLAYKDIADVMKCSVSSVESRLFRARQHLATLLKDTT